MRLATSPVLLGALLATACLAAAPPLSRARDSAGVRIVENDAPAGLPFTLDSVPAYDIGPAGGPESEFISSPVSALRLANRRIAAAGWAMTEVKLFDSTGRWLRTIGRSGGGPGEFEALGFVFQGGGDSITTFEPGTQRLQRWTGDLEFVDLSLLVTPAIKPGAWVRGTFGDGSLLLHASRPGNSAPTDPVMRNVVTLFRRTVTESPWDSVVAYPSAPAVRDPQYVGSSLGNALFAPMPNFSVRGSRLAFTNGARFEIEIRSPTGGLRMIVRRTAAPRAVTENEVDRAVQFWAARLPERIRADQVPVMLRASTSRVRPPIAEVWLADDGRIRGIFGDPVIGEPIRASVFDSLGRWEGDLELPPDLVLNQIDGDGLLATFIDPDGFRHLRFYRLRPRRR